MKSETKYKASLFRFSIVTFLFGFLFFASLFSQSKGSAMALVWGLGALYVLGEFFRTLEIFPHEIRSRGFLGVINRNYPMDRFLCFRAPRFYEAGDVVGTLLDQKTIKLKLPLFSRGKRKELVALCQKLLEARE